MLNPNLEPLVTHNPTSNINGGLVQAQANPIDPALSDPALSAQIKVSHQATAQDAAITAALARLNDKISSVASQATGSVLKACLDEIDAKTIQLMANTHEAIHELMAFAQKTSDESKVVIGVSINGDPAASLKHAGHPMLPSLAGFLKAGITPMLVGPAGSGKTMLAGQAAEALALPFGHVCLTAGASETWLFGRQTPTGFIEGEFSRMYREGGVFLADEFDAADANMLLCLNTAISNGVLYNPISGATNARHADFHFIAAANTVGKGANHIYTGRNRIDAATLNRFAILTVDYVRAIEDGILAHAELAKALRDARHALKTRGAEEIISYRQFDQAARMLRLDMTPTEIIACLTQAWPDGLAEEISFTCIDANPANSTDAPKKRGRPPGSVNKTSAAGIDLTIKPVWKFDPKNINDLRKMYDDSVKDAGVPF